MVSPLPAGVSQVVTQGTITSANAAAIVTDDPTTPEANDATRTAVVARPIVEVTLQDTLVVDADGDGVPSPGDTLFYTVVVRNDGNAAAGRLQFTDALDPNTTLVVGSVQTSQGTVTTGNNPETRALVSTWNDPRRRVEHHDHVPGDDQWAAERGRYPAFDPGLCDLDQRADDAIG